MRQIITLGKGFIAMLQAYKQENYTEDSIKGYLLSLQNLANVTFHISLDIFGECSNALKNILFENNISYNINYNAARHVIECTTFHDCITLIVHILYNASFLLEMQNKIDLRRQIDTYLELFLFIANKLSTWQKEGYNLTNILYMLEALNL